MKRSNLIILLVSLVVVSAAALAQNRAAAVVDSLPSVKKIEQVAISPDGTQVAYIVGGQASVATVAASRTRNPSACARSMPFHALAQVPAPR